MAATRRCGGNVRCAGEDAPGEDAQTGKEEDCSQILFSKNGIGKPFYDLGPSVRVSTTYDHTCTRCTSSPQRITLDSASSSDSDCSDRGNTPSNLQPDFEPGNSITGRTKSQGSPFGHTTWPRLQRERSSAAFSENFQLSDTKDTAAIVHAKHCSQAHTSRQRQRRATAI